MTHSPQVKTNRFFSTSLAIFFVRFFPTLVSLMVMIGFSRQLPEATYGNYQGFWTSYYVLSAIACAGIPAFMMTYSRGYLQYLFRQLKPLQLSGYGLWLLLLAATFAFLEWVDAGTAFWVPACFLIVSALSSILESYHTVARRFGMLIIVNTVYALAFLYVHWQVLQRGWPLSQLFTAITLLAGAKLVLYLLALTGEKRVITEAELDMYRHSRPGNLWMHMGIYDVSQMVFKWLDKFIIALLLSSQVTAIYFNGSVEIPFLPVILGAAGSAILMQLSFHQNSKNEKHTVQLMLHSGRLLSSIVFPVFFFFLLFAQELFAVVFTEKYAASVPVFIVAVCVLPLRAYSFTTILQHRQKGALINAGAMLEVVVALLMVYPMYLLAGLQGVALCFVLTTYLQASFYLYHSARLIGGPVWKIIPLKHWLVKLIILSLSFIVIHYTAVSYLSMQNALICGGVFTILAIAVAMTIELKQQSNGAAQTAE